MYATGGRDFCILANVVDKASNVLTPNVTRAGACEHDNSDGHDIIVLQSCDQSRKQTMRPPQSSYRGHTWSPCSRTTL